VPSVMSESIVDATTARRVWPLLEDGARLASLVAHVLEVAPAPAGARRWRVLLNGSEVRWQQRAERAPGELRFEQTAGDLDRLRGAWTLSERDGAMRLALRIDFHLGVDGLAPLLDPIWTQSFQAHADALVNAVTRVIGDA
jgi:hypothetical protein